MLSSGPAGFEGAPFSRWLILGVCGVAAFLRTGRINQQGVGQAVVHLLKFRTLGDLVFGTALLYYFRVFERQRGSERYSAFSLVTLAVDSIVHWAFQLTARWSIAAGPYSVIAAHCVSFLMEIPATQHFKLLGISFTEKVIVYGAVAQLLLSSARQAWFSCMIGASAGLAYQTDLFGCRSIAIPQRISKLIGSLVTRIFGSTANEPQVTVPGGPPRSHARFGSADGYPSPQVAAASVSEDALTQLVAMGFEEEQAANALRQTHNDLQAAVTRLL